MHSVKRASVSWDDAGWCPFYPLMHAEPDPAEALPMQRAATGIEVRGEILEIARDDGGRVTMLVNATPVRGESGAITGAVGVCVDITTLRAAEEALRESERRFARFMQHLPGLAWIKDLRGRYVFVN